MKKAFEESICKFVDATYLTGGEAGIKQFTYSGILSIDNFGGKFFFRFMSTPFAGTSRVTGSDIAYNTFEEALSGAEEHGISVDSEENTPLTA